MPSSDEDVLYISATTVEYICLWGTLQSAPSGDRPTHRPEDEFRLESTWSGAPLPYPWSRRRCRGHYPRGPETADGLRDDDVWFGHAGTHGIRSWLWVYEDYWKQHGITGVNCAIDEQTQEYNCRMNLRNAQPIVAHNRDISAAWDEVISKLGQAQDAR